MVELSPPYFAANSSKVLRVQLRVEPPVRSPSKRKLPPTIPTISRPCRPRQGRTGKISKTYFVGILAPPRSKSKISSKEAARELQSASAHEQTKAEQRICFREGRANRFLFDRAFPALTNEAILPGWQWEKEEGPTLVKPTLSSLRRKRTMDLDRLDRDSESSPKSLAPWKPADNSRKIDHPGNVALSRVRARSAGETKPHINRRKTLTAQQLETFETRAAGRERAERLLERIRNRNAAAQLSRSFQERIRAEARRAGRAGRAGRGQESEATSSPGSPASPASPRSLDMTPA
mmetsp:Transcript_112402/g.157589  ORF Transcript_112402/g.157589 Transcript_112402/m.157589 type:complete len:292 (+) Transcript_112402:37-912(+)|eukprot:s600_g20.t1